MISSSCPSPALDADGPDVHCLVNVRTTGDPVCTQLVVLNLLSRGTSASNIGRWLGISPRTVHKHVEHLCRKLDVHDRHDAIHLAGQLGLLTINSQPHVRERAPHHPG